ncbi:MAG TPA: ABC transporter permease, partial [Gammaproteobacteria bacterium]
MPVFALVKKELKLLLRDWHALLLLFVMPAVFILVMSLAMQSGFASHAGVSVHYYLLDQDRGPESSALIKRLESVPDFKLTESTAPADELIERVRR